MALPYSPPAAPSPAATPDIPWGPGRGGTVELNQGERVLSPQAPPSRGVPSWQQFTPPQYLNQPPVQAQQDFQYQPQGNPQFPYASQPQPAPTMPYAPQQPYQPVVQQPVHPSQYQQPHQSYQQPTQPAQPPVAPAPINPAQPFTMAPDPRQAPVLPYQFTDGLQLGGMTGQPPQQFIAPPAAPTAPPAQQPQVPATLLRDQLASQGLPVGQYPSDQALLDDLGNTVLQAQRLRWEQANQQQQVPLGQPAAPTLPVPVQPPSKPTKSQKPEWNSNWDGMVKRDAATGRFVPADSMVNPIVADRANELAAWERSRAQQLVNEGLTREDLDLTLAEKLEAVKAEVRAEIAAEEQARAGQQQVQQFLQSNQAAFFQLDQHGQPVRNPVTGQPVTTAIGQAAFAYGNQYAQHFEQSYGVAPNPAQVIEYVQLKLTADQAAGRLPPAAPQAAPNYPVGPTSEQIKEQVLANAIARQRAVAAAAHVPNQAGTLAEAAQQATLPQNTRLDFKQMLMASGISRGTVQPEYIYQR